MVRENGWPYGTSVVEMPKERYHRADVWVVGVVNRNTPLVHR